MTRTRGCRGPRGRRRRHRRSVRIAVLDASVLYGAFSRDVLLRLAAAGLYRVAGRSVQNVAVAPSASCYAAGGPLHEGAGGSLHPPPSRRAKQGYRATVTRRTNRSMSSMYGTVPFSGSAWTR